MPVFTLPLVTALATALVLAGIRPPQNPPQDSAPAAVKSTPYDHTAVGAVLRANGGRAPASGEELVRALKRVGDFTQLPVTYSAVNPTTSLTSPRIILAPRPGGKAADAEAPADDEKTRPGGLGLPVFQPPKPVRLDRLPPISTAKATEPNVEGRLFFAANFEKDGEGKPRVKTIEFISWNSRKKRFDFGVIECGPPPVELQILDGVRCFSCHKNKGPILGQGPWSNTMHNDVVRTAALQTILLKNEPVLPGSPPVTFQPGFAGPPFITPDLKEKTTFDGLSVVFTEPETCDAAVRQGSNLARDREV